MQLVAGLPCLPRRARRNNKLPSLPCACLQLELDALEDVHVVHAQQHRLACRGVCSAHAGRLRRMCICRDAG